MRKLIRSTLAVLALAAVVGMIPAHARAVGYEDSLDDCAYPKLFDAAIMRPISFNVMIIGAVGLVAFTATIIGPAMVNTDYPEVAYLMVVPAAKFTFARPLGQCVAISSGY